MAGTHKQLRLRKPAHWASKVRAVDGKHLKIFPAHTPHPAWSLRRLAILRAHKGIHEFGETRLPLGKLIELAERNPLVVSTLLLDRRQQIPNHRYCDGRAHDHIECSPNPHKQPSPCYRFFFTHALVLIC